MQIHFITGNQHKLAEVQAILPEVVQLDIDLPEIQSNDPQEIIEVKLIEALKHHNGPCIVEDTGLYLDAMNGLPGPFIKFFIKSLGSLGLAEMIMKL